MMCDACKKEFSVEKEPGALLFGPPTNEYQMTVKRHICATCYPKLLKIFFK